MDITITAFPEEELAAIAQWRSDGEVHRYLRHGYTTLEEVGKWYRDYFASEANQLLVSDHGVNSFKINGLIS